MDKTYKEYKDEYKEIVRSISSFFNGNTKEVKAKIMSDIQESIKKEHFERCITLRDILSQIDDRSEKQHVVLDPVHSGTIVRISSTEKFWIIILVKIFEGKMTDVIREKKPKQDRSIEQMISSLESDFGEMTISQAANDTHTLFSTSMKKLKKSDTKEIDLLFNKFLESYIASTSFDMTDNLNQEMLQQIQKRYFLTQLPYHIECVDISHLS